MKLKVKFLQAGGQMPEEQPAQTAPAEGAAPTEGAQGGDPMQQILDVIMQLGDMAAKALQSNDPQAMGQVWRVTVRHLSQQAQFSNRFQYLRIAELRRPLCRCAPLGEQWLH